MAADILRDFSVAPFWVPKQLGSCDVVKFAATETASLGAAGDFASAIGIRDRRRDW